MRSVDAGLSNDYRLAISIWDDNVFKPHKSERRGIIATLYKKSPDKRGFKARMGGVA